MNVKDKIVQALEESLSKIGVVKPIVLTDARNFGDFATNLALTLKKDLNKSPLEIAELIVANINLSKYEIEKVEIAGAGFINFFMKKNVFATEVNTIIAQGENFGKGKQNQKINIEFVSANPTGWLHIAHARGAVLGSTLANILSFAGNEVTREYYLNDAGNQIDRVGISAFTRYLQALGKEVLMPEDSYIGEDIKWVGEVLKNKFQNKYENASYESVKDIFKQEAITILIERIKEDLLLFRVQFDQFTSEASLYQKDAIKNTLNQLQDIYQQDGATWLRTTKYGDDKDRVLIKQDGVNTYLLPDIVNHHQKFLRNGGQDKLINIWGADHIGYVKRLEIALKQLGYDTQEKMRFLICQTVRLIKGGQEFKMSKRKGNAIALREFIELAGVDAARFFMIDRSENSGIDFDLDLTLEQNSANPVFSIQYAHARATKLINKYEGDFQATTFSQEYEFKLINTLKEFPDVIKGISNSYKVHILPQYLIRLSRDFNSFYSNCRIIGNINENSLFALVKATKIVLKTGLNLIGVSAPEGM